MIRSVAIIGLIVATVLSVNEVHAGSGDGEVAHGERIAISRIPSIVVRSWLSSGWVPRNRRRSRSPNNSSFSSGSSGDTGVRKPRRVPVTGTSQLGNCTIAAEDYY